MDALYVNTNNVGSITASQSATESNSSYNGGYMSEEITNFSYQGLIFGLKWQGNF